MGVRRSVLAVEDDEDDVTETRPRPVRQPRSVAAVPDDEDVLQDEDEDEVPERASVVQAGWESAKKALASSGGSFTEEFKFREDAQIVKFLSSAPIAVYRQHWLDNKEGKKSFVCLGIKCPLCETLGDVPSQKIAFSVLNLSAEGDDKKSYPSQLVIAGMKFANQLKKLNDDPKVGPLDKGFWALSKSGQKQQTSYAAMPIKARDLADDWDVDPSQVEEALRTAKPLDSSVIRLERQQDLQDIARELAA